MSVIKLYRGDEIANQRTKPARYRSEGMLSGAFGSGGDPVTVERIGLLETVKRHIDHIKEYEKAYYAISDYISFSESKERAKAWAARLKPADLITCSEPYLETRYVFEMVFDTKDLIKLEEGVWEYRFTCNPALKSPYVKSDDPIKSIALDYALKYPVCVVCDLRFKNHSLIIIQPEKILPADPGDDTYARAIKLAAKNAEWLILPNDIINFGFRGTRIPPANFWCARGYILKGETARDPYELIYPEFPLP
jgi:hypothetical protein